MNVKPFCLSAGVALLLCSCASPRHTQKDSSEAAAVRTEFDPDFVLSPSELDNVIKLANECGVTNVVKVYTYNIHPSSSYGIGAESIETVRGRKVTIVRIFINDEKWVRPRWSEVVLKSIDRFWAGDGDLRTNTLTTFAVPGGSARVQLSDSVPLPIADRIIDAFAAGKIRYRDGKFKEDLKGVSATQAECLFANSKRDVFSLCFSCGSLCLLSVDCTLQSDGISCWYRQRGNVSEIE